MTSKLIWTLFLLICLRPSIAIGEGRFSQLILDFPNERPFEYRAIKSENALILYFGKTIPSELNALNTYDERLIKRVFIKQINNDDTEVKLVFKDRSIRALVTKIFEPYRVIIDLFDKNYSPQNDPITGLPMASIGKLSPDQHEQVNEIENPSFENQQQDQEISMQAGNFYDNQNDSGFGKRKLLQPTPDEIFSLPQLQESITNVPEGRSKHWNTFPPYIYPIQTAVYQGRKNPSGYLKRLNSKSLTTAQAMAEQGLKLFSFGHEGRALIAYQQVLHKDPGIFDKDALHLWAFSEIHMGQGNLTLANGYYSSLISKHPNSTLSTFAKMRKLDIKAIRLWESNQTNYLDSLLKELNLIQSQNQEVLSQLEIRRAYWRPEGHSNVKESLPRTKQDITNKLSAQLPEVESQRTAFISSSIIAKNMIRSDRPWDPSGSNYLGQYFKKYSGSGSEPYLSQLKKELRERLTSLIVQKEKEKDYVGVIDIYSNLPNSIQAIKKFENISWSLAESYRNTGHQEKSLDFYESVADKSKTGLRKVKSLFWAATTNAKIGRTSKGNKAKTHRNKARRYDTQMNQVWNGLNSQEQQQFLSQYKNHLEATTSAIYSLKSPSLLVLQQWESQLGSNLNGTNNSKPTDIASNYSPGSSGVTLLTNLSKKFQSLGMQKEKTRTIKLLKRLNPSDFADNAQAKAIWNKQLLSLAEEYRKENNYLEAGRLYTLTAEKNPSSENRAESLYKGGLLLYRAGKKSEAIEAFTAASEDGNNLFYSNLAKERLSQLQE